MSPWEYTIKYLELMQRIERARKRELRRARSDDEYRVVEQ